MFKGNRKYFFILGICFVVLIILQLIAPKKINWSPSYMKKETAPFGTSALFEMLPFVFPGQPVTVSAMPAYNSLDNTEGQLSNYVVINSSFEPDKYDSQALMDYVAEGNNVFIAANYFEGDFADTLKLKTDNYYSIKDQLESDSLSVSSMYHPYDTADINFTSPSLKRKPSYVYAKGIDNTFFTSFDTASAVVLGTNSIGKPNLVKFSWGEGSIFISSIPEVYTNYLFVDEKNHDYAYKSLSFLPNREVIWDEYYKIGNVKKENLLRVVFNNPALLTAYYLLMGSLLLFIIIGIKRRQRIIPVVEPLRNTTLDFVDTVGTLYYQTGNHKNIANKKISYFLEYIRSAFQVQTALYDDTFIDRITSLSGIDRNKIHDLFYYFSDLSLKETITQQELQKLNRMIENFHKENKR
ncbi:MAG: DUF4350 domain-containing protein [Bacteroidia bacterium]